MKLEVNVAWPELVAYDDSATDLLMEQPEFEWDNWASFIGELADDLDAELRKAGCSAILDITTDGMSVEGTTWTTPQEMLAAIARLRTILHNGSTLAAALIDSYNNVNYRERPGEPLQLMCEDLDVLAAQAQWALDRGMTRVCVAINV